MEVFFLLTLVYLNKPFVSFVQPFVSFVFKVQSSRFKVQAVPAEAFFDLRRFYRRR